MFSWGSRGLLWFPQVQPGAWGLNAELPLKMLLLCEAKFPEHLPCLRWPSSNLERLSVEDSDPWSCRMCHSPAQLQSSSFMPPCSGGVKAQGGGSTHCSTNADLVMDSRHDSWCFQNKLLLFEKCFYLLMLNVSLLQAHCISHWMDPVLGTDV